MGTDARHSKTPSWCSNSAPNSPRYDPCTICLEVQANLGAQCPVIAAVGNTALLGAFEHMIHCGPVLNMDVFMRAETIGAEEIVRRVAIEADQVFGLGIANGPSIHPENSILMTDCFVIPTAHQNPRT